MICIYCNKEMRKDDVDFSFRGNKDIYWQCYHCSSSCIEKIRFNKSLKILWYKSSDNEAIKIT